MQLKRLLLLAVLLLAVTGSAAYRPLRVQKDEIFAGVVNDFGAIVRHELLPAEGTRSRKALDYVQPELSSALEGLNLLVIRVRPLEKGLFLVSFQAAARNAHEAQVLAKSLTLPFEAWKLALVARLKLRADRAQLAPLCERIKSAKISATDAVLGLEISLRSNEVLYLLSVAGR